MHTRLRGPLVALCVTAALVVARDAQAAPRLAAVTGTTGVGTGLGDSRLWAELGFYSGSSFTSLSSELGFGLSLSRGLEVEAVLPLAFARPPADEDDGFALGNPYVGLNIFHGILRWSLGVALPVASEGDGDVVPLYGALATRGLQDIYLWEPDTLALVTRLRAETGDRLVLAFDGAAILSIPSGDLDERDVELTLQPAGELIFHVTPATSLGARLSLAWLATRSEEDNAQLALTPFLRHDFGSTFITAQLLMNLDGPRGFAFDENGFWGLFLGFGGGL